MSIETNVIQFVETNSTPAFQDWDSLNPIPFTYVISNPGLIFPSMIPVAIKDYIGTSEGSAYTAFRIKAQKYFFGASAGVDWALINSSLFSANLSGAVLTENLTQNGVIDNLNISMQNLSTVLEGVYECRVQYTIEGRNVSGAWIQLSYYTQRIILSVYQEQTITWSPEPFVMNHFQGVTNPIQEITMDGPNWTVNTPADFILESDDPSVTINTWTSFAGTHYSASGIGTAIIKLKLGTFFNTPQAILQSPFNRTLNVFSGISTFVGAISYVVNVFEQQPFYVEPTSLYFQGVKGLEEPELQNVLVAALNAYTVSKPYWLDVTPENEIEPGNHTNLVVKPIHSNNLTGGTYTGDIVLTSGADSITIPVVYVLNDFVNIPYDRDANNFTKDPLFLEFYTQFENTYFEMLINVEAQDYDFQTAMNKNIIIQNKIPLFNKYQKMHIGELVEKVFYNLTNANTNANAIYNPAKVNVSIQEKQYPTHEVLREGALEEIVFLSGLTPKNRNGNVAFLEISKQTKRVYKSSFDFVNLMLPNSNDYELRIYKATDLLETRSLYPTTTVHREKLDFSQINCNQGDVLDVKVWSISEDEEVISKKYLIFPEEEYSNMILWEDEYRVIQSFHFTGKHQIKNDYTANQFKNYRDFVETVKKLSSIKDLKLSINTGFITKNDIPYLDSIISAKKAWIYLSEEKKIEIIPNTKSLVFDDIDREIISFDLEFDINKTYDEENFTL